MSTNVKKASNRWKQFNFDTSDLNCNSDNNETIDLTAECNGFQAQVRENFNFERKIEPRQIEDLSVHKKKVKDVEAWLENNVLAPERKCNSSMLLLTGPTGCGKTATVRLLCQAMNIEISEWINPVDREFELFRQPGQSAQFLEFFSESKYPSLFSLNRPKITLVEDYPNSVIHNPSEFVGILQKCYDSKTSIIFVCTNASSRSLNLSETLFPQETRDKYSIDNISFNPCTVTLMKQALKRAQNIVQENLDALRIPAPSVVESIISSAMGDIRCAVNQFYFACLKGSSDLPTVLNKGASKSGNKRKRNKKSECAAATNMTKDESLGLFHSLGRVLNPKRQEMGGTWKIQCDLDSLIDELCTQPGTFNAFLHENYLKYFGDINDTSRAAEILSIAQVFLSNWWDKGDGLSFALWLSVLGLMVCNEHKVSQWTPIRAPRKLKRAINDNLVTTELHHTDRCYYNIIMKSEKFHKFQIC